MRYLVQAHSASYRSLMRAAARFSDPFRTSEWIGYVAFGLALAAALAAAGPGWLGLAWVALLLASHQFDRFSGGFPRTFGLLTCALTLSGAISGRLWPGVLASLGASAFYPPMVLFLAGVLAGQTLLPARWLGLPADAPARTGVRLATLALTGLACAFLILPQLAATRGYGRAVGPSDWREFPEVGPGGILVGRSDRPRFQEALSLPLLFSELAARTLEPQPGSLAGRLVPSPGGMPPVAGGLVLGLVTSVLLRGALHKGDTRARGLLLCLGVMTVAFAMAVAVQPLLYLPRRQIGYPFGQWLCAAIAVAPFTPGGRLHPVWRIAPALVLAGLIGSNSGYGLRDRVDLRDPPAVFVANRRAFHTYEYHTIPFHGEILLKARARMNALVDAYLADGEEPLRQLRDDFGVTHLLIERGHFSDGPPTYFEPFGTRIRERIEHLEGRPPAGLREPASRAVIYEDFDFRLLDLRLL